jgi:hypothetical protein
MQPIALPEIQMHLPKYRESSERYVCIDFLTF